MYFLIVLIAIMLHNKSNASINTVIGDRCYRIGRY